MMKELLEKDFICHYKLGKCKVVLNPTNEVHFDLKDDHQMIYPSGEGVSDIVIQPMKK